MIKKAITYSLLLIANVALLAHIVLPHHHHTRQNICIEIIHFDEAITDCINDLHKKNHQHGCNPNSSTCILKQAVIIPSAMNKISVHDNLNYNFFLISFLEWEHHRPVSRFIGPSEELPSFFTSVVSNSSGLRAPPIV